VPRRKCGEGFLTIHLAKIYQIVGSPENRRFCGAEKKGFFAKVKEIFNKDK